LRLLLIPWWVVVEKGASFFEGCRDGFLPRGHLDEEMVFLSGGYIRRR